MNHTKTIKISQLKNKEMQEFLDGKGDGSLNTIETFTANFGNDGDGIIEVDIKVCDGEGNPFIDPVIFVNGCDSGCLDVEGTLIGEYIFELDGDTYTVLVEEIMGCECGNTEFYAHQLCRMNVVVDADNEWLRNSPEDNSACYDFETPYGPFTCTECKKEYEELPEK